MNTILKNILFSNCCPREYTKCKNTWLVISYVEPQLYFFCWFLQLQDHLLLQCKVEECLVCDQKVYCWPCKMCRADVSSFPGPAQLPTACSTVLYCTASGGKLGRAWEEAGANDTICHSFSVKNLQILHIQWLQLGGGFPRGFPLFIYFCLADNYMCTVK